MNRKGKRAVPRGTKAPTWKTTSGWRRMDVGIVLTDEDDNESEYKVVGSYRPARPAPKVSDPDAPGFSDPGDGAEVEVDIVYRVMGGGTIISLDDRSVRFLDKDNAVSNAALEAMTEQ